MTQGVKSFDILDAITKKLLSTNKKLIIGIDNYNSFAKDFFERYLDESLEINKVIEVKIIPDWIIDNFYAKHHNQDTYLIANIYNVYMIDGVIQPQPFFFDSKLYACHLFPMIRPFQLYFAEDFNQPFNLDCDENIAAILRAFYKYSLADPMKLGKDDYPSCLSENYYPGEELNEDYYPSYLNEEYFLSHLAYN
jgi:hypothetical protein